MDAVTDATFDDEVLKAGLPVLVEFTADWCGPCRQLAPVLSDVARKEIDKTRVDQVLAGLAPFDEKTLLDDHTEAPDAAESRDLPEARNDDKAPAKV
ncbi:hypothetical protein J7E96_03860 [Streptomyces sp. ISL-96]|nr:hypothetical protein [Streptomyces sp. ISL-96]